MQQIFFTPHFGEWPKSMERTFACIANTFHQDILWEAAVRNTLVCLREPQNTDNRHAVAFEKNGTVTYQTLAKKSGKCLFAVPKMSEDDSLLW